MRVIIILAVIAFTHGAKLEKAYLPPSNAPTAGGSGNFLQTPTSGLFPQPNDYSHSGAGIAQNGAAYNNVNYNFANQGRVERPRAAFERNAAILRQDNTNNGDSYSYAYETENGIYAEERGVATNGVQAQGGYSYTGDDGQVYSVRYTADQNGFVPQGDHLPTPPPVPEEILRALEQNARDEAAGIYDDGSYNEGKYGAPNAQYLPPSNAARTIAPTYGAPSAPAFNVAGNRNAPSYTGNAPSFNGNTPFNAPNAGVIRNSAAEKAYLPPFAGQRGQNRNTFGSRQQSFNSRTGYNY